MTEEQLMSQEKFEELTKELERRKTVLRKEITDALEFAKQLGDLSENFEYHDAKERQGENEHRIHQIDTMLKNAKIVEEQTGGTKIEVGSKFVAEKGGQEITFQIVGSQDANPVEGKISNESPIGEAFLGAQVGDAINVDTPSGAVQYTVKSIL